MQLTGLHLLLTYQCTMECDHCFVWGSPWQSAVMTRRQVDNILQQAQEAESVEWIYFEGGEPFLYYALLVHAVESAAASGFHVGLVSNGYWATSLEDARAWLGPFVGLVEDLSLSCDQYHGDEESAQRVAHAHQAARALGIPTGVIQVASPGAQDAVQSSGQLPQGESAVMYRGRAVEKLSGRATTSPWSEFTTCPYEDLREPGRVHVDPFGHLHLCQGISLGNLFQMPLREICERYQPDRHPIAGPLLAGGPAELVRRYEVPHQARYAGACHLCDQTRQQLRADFPEILTPDQMYGQY
jgi:MoaA/NifB/PqqE/SkfB family radical SAM enzyme